MVSNVNYRALFEHAPDSYLVLAPDPPRFTIIAADEVRLRSTMTRREDIIGRPVFEVFPDNPDTPRAKGVAHLRESLESVIRDRAQHRMSQQRYDIRGPGGDFEERYWEPLNVPVFDDSGNLIHIIHRVEDVTDQVHSRIRLETLGAEASAAREKETALRDLAGRLVGAASVREVVQAVAEKAVEYTGALGAYVERVDAPEPGSEVEVIATSGAGVPPPGTRVPYPGSLTEEIMETGDSEIMTEVGAIGSSMAPYLGESCRNCSGLVVPLVAESRTLGALVLLRGPEQDRFGEGEALFARAIGDAASTALRRALLLEQISESEEKFRELAENIHEVCWIFGPDLGHTHFVSPAYETIWGRSTASLYRDPRSFLEAIHPEDRPRVDEFLDRLRREEANTECRIIRPDGEMRWLLVRGFPVWAENGEVKRIVGISEDTTERRARDDDQRFLVQAGKALSSSLDYLQTIDQIAHLAVPRIADWCAVDVVEEGAIRRLIVTDRGPSRESEVGTWTTPLVTERDAGTARVMRTGEPELHPEILEEGLVEHLHDEEEYRTLLEVGARSAMITPMIIHGKTIGTITFVAAGSGRRFGSRELELAEALTDRAALAVDNARLYLIAEEARRRAERREQEEAMISDLARAFSIEIEIDKIAELITRTAAEATSAMGAYIERVEPTGEEVEVIAAAGPGTPAIGTRAPYPGSLTEEILAGGRAHLVTEISMIGEAVAPYLIEHCGDCSGLVVPFVSAGEPLGTLVLLRGAAGPGFGEADAERANILGDLASLAFRRALLVEAEQEARGEAERRAREERALREAAEAVTSTFTEEEVIRQIAQSALTATNADGTVVERIDIASGSVEIVAGAGERTIPIGARARYSGSLAEQVVERRESTFVPHLADAAGRISPDLLRVCPECSALAVPLLNAGEAIGALILLRDPAKWGFRPDEIERARSFANLAALTFRKVHLLEDSEKRREELERVMASRARLIRGFSHDVKNPLGAADGYLQLMEEEIVGSLTDKQEESVERARRSLQAALRLIEDLLEVARAEAGEVEVEWSAVDMRDAAREISEEYRAQAEAKGLSFSVEIPTEMTVIHSDSDRARQVLGNLISNAVKYTERGGISIRMETREGGGAPGAGRWIAVDVVDSGPGIPAEEERLLFQEFQRLENSGREGGMGIGLAISMRIAQALGGTITVASNVGLGSTFTLWLPVENE